MKKSCYAFNIKIHDDKLEHRGICMLTEKEVHKWRYDFDINQYFVNGQEASELKLKKYIRPRPEIYKMLYINLLFNCLFINNYVYFIEH